MSSTDSERCCRRALSNGDIYEGEFDGSVPNGRGKYFWSNGTCYEGGWDKSRIQGNGRVLWPSGATYEGELCGGFLHGFGTLHARDGSIYKGCWRMNIQHGLGTKTYSNSDSYDGFWREGLQGGVGKYTWSNGDTYIGNWKSGKMNGRGIMSWANGELFDGFWSDGLQHGVGYYKFPSGGYYFGTWSRGLKDGRGIFVPVGSNLAYDHKCHDPVGYYDKICNFRSASSVNYEETRNKTLGFGSRGSKRWSTNTATHSDHLSNSFDSFSSLSASQRTIPSRGSSRTMSCSSGEDDNEIQVGTLVVFEREYMQGVLVMERERTYDSRILQKRKWQMISKQRRGLGETIYRGHKSYYLMWNLQLGIRYTVGKITPVPKRQVRASDFGYRARICMYFPSNGSQMTPPHDSIDFYWKDYCPMVFRNLREMFKIDAADYMMSICGGDGLKELSSPGKSGSIFYLSQDERFVIKTLRKNELKILLKMLPKYYSHVGAYENTLITKFFGLHRITVRGGRKIRFVVMGNMFWTELRIHRRYDMKGSSQGRSTDKNKITESTTLKDLDLSYAFQLEKTWRESLFRQISLDCMFLESQSIIDYSMLLGLHFRAPDSLKALFESQVTMRHTASSPTDVSLPTDAVVPPKGLLLVTHEPSSVSHVPGSHIRGSTLRAAAVGNEEVDLLLPGTGRLRVQLGVNMPAQANRKLIHEASPNSAEIDLFEVYDVVLYLGIIDILQQYNMTKKIEHACKSLKFDPMSISAVEPELYSTRFITFLEKVFPEQI